MIKYTNSHEWVSVQEDIGTVGITDYAQQELGQVVFVSLPPLGTKLIAGQEAAILESTKAAADIYAPLSGEVVEINKELNDCPQLINSFAETQGWLFKVKIDNKKELQDLLTLEGYNRMIRS